MRVVFSTLLIATLCVSSSALAQNEGENPAAKAIQDTGAQVLQLAQNDDRLDVAYHLTSVTLTPEILQTLAGAKDKIYALNLRGTNVDDTMLAHVAPLGELVRLHLEKTKITDAGLAHLANLQKLEYLNLYGTQITDAGLAQLPKLAALKKVYVWETAVTLDGVRALREAKPDLEVIGGPPEPKVIHPVEAAHPAKPEPPKEEPAKPEPAKEERAKEEPAK